MPMYEYKCAKCDSRFEELVSSSKADEKVPCPECGSKKTSRVLSTFAVSVKGGGATSGAELPACAASGRCDPSSGGFS